MLSKTLEKLFNLFELERLLLTQEDKEEEDLVLLTGKLSKEHNFFEHIESEYFKTLSLPWRFWRIHGIDFIIDVYDRGNGWYNVIKIKEIK